MERKSLLKKLINQIMPYEFFNETSYPSYSLDIAEQEQNNNNMKVPTILNTSILTDFGSYDYKEISLQEARKMIRKGFSSAVGHQSTCDVLNPLLRANVPMNRIFYKQEVGDVALVFKLNGRPPEGKILTVEEIEEIGYSFGRLVRLS